MKSDSGTGPIELDIERNRGDSKYSYSIQVRRVVWTILRPLFKYSPRPFFSWRRFLLKIQGAKVGSNVNIYSSSMIYFPWNLEIGDWSSIGEHAYIYNLGIIRIGEKTTVSQRVHLCAGTHDYTDPTLPLRKPGITIENEVWVAADAFIGPGVTVHSGAVVGARSVVCKDVDSWLVVAGNPAKAIKKRVLVSTDGG